jgi:hypothetical protein
VKDESALRLRLHEELDSVDFGPAPVEPVFRRYRATRLRQLATVAGTALAVAAVAAALAARGPAQPRPHVTPVGGAAGGGIFASGRIGRQAWRMAAADLAAPGRRCLPGVVFNGQNGDLLLGGIPPGLALGDAGFLAQPLGIPGGITFLRLRPGMRDLTVSLGDRTTLSIAARVVTLCGRRFRLAGFVYPAQGVRQVTARAASGREVFFRPDPYLFNPRGNLMAEGWFNYQGLTNDAAAGTIGSGRIHGTAWRASVTLGSNGECFLADIGPGNGSSVSLCQPVSAPAGTASLGPIGYARAPGILLWYMGTVNIGTAYATAHLSDGTAERIFPAVVGGRNYVAVGFASPVRLIELTLYNARGRVLAKITNIPPFK